VTSYICVYTYIRISHTKSMQNKILDQGKLHVLTTIQVYLVSSDSVLVTVLSTKHGVALCHCRHSNDDEFIFRRGCHTSPTARRCRGWCSSLRYFFDIRTDMVLPNHNWYSWHLLCLGIQGAKWPIVCWYDTMHELISAFGIVYVSFVPLFIWNRPVI